jgi:hypothetical protein
MGTRMTTDTCNACPMFEVRCRSLSYRADVAVGKTRDFVPYARDGWMARPSQ